MHSVCCKVADFGLAKDMGKTEGGANKTYYVATQKGALPIRWSAPEASPTPKVVLVVESHPKSSTSSRVPPKKQY